MSKPRARGKGRKPSAPPARKRRPQLKAGELDWKNYPSLRRFLSERGKIRARRITGLSRRQQAMLAAAVKRAREMGLLQYPDQDRRVRTQRGPDPAFVGTAVEDAVETDVAVDLDEDSGYAGAEDVEEYAGDDDSER